MKILVTAGPTREYLDSVRFISNPSTGIMGYLIAQEAVRRKHKVILISGPVNLAVPEGVKVVNVVSANQMHEHVLKFYRNVDCVVMAAAVSDYTPLEVFKGKIKKKAKKILIRLIRTKDILKELGKNKKGRILVGFALETSHRLKNARMKMQEKNLDIIVANTPGSFGKNLVDADIILRNGRIYPFKHISKHNLSKRLIKLIEMLHVNN